MKKFICIVTLLMCMVGFSTSVLGWDEGGWDGQVVKYIRMTTDPAVTDSNFTVPYVWINETTDKAYLLVDNSVGAAKWREVMYTGATPSFVTVDLTGVTDGNLPKMGAAAAGFADSLLSDNGTVLTDAGDLTVSGGDLILGTSAVQGTIAAHDAAVITMYDDGDNTSVAIGPVGDGTTTLGVTGSLDVSGTVDAGTLTIGSGSITDSSAAISFGDENLSTTGTAVIGGTNTTIIRNAVERSSALTAHGDGTGNQILLHVQRHADTGGTNALVLGSRSRGTMASPTIVQDGNTLMAIVGAGYDGVDYANGARIAIQVDGTPGSDDMPGRIVLITTPDGAASGTERVRVDNAGTTILGSGEGAAAAPTGNTFRAPDTIASGTDVAGADLTIGAGLGTGAGDVGQIIFQTPRVLGSGTTLQTRTTLMTLDGGIADVDGAFTATSVTADANIAGATYGSDSSITDAELLTLDNGATTEILVGGGAGSAPVWTTATGTDAPVRAGSPTFTGTPIAPTIDLTGVTDGNIPYMQTGAAGFVDSSLSEGAAGLTLQSDKLVVVDTFTSAGINAAIDALGAEGGEVYLPEGDYDVTASIVIDYDNTTLRGAGKGTRLLATNRFVYTTVTGTPAAGETLTGDTNSYTATVVKVDLTNKIVWYHTLSNPANFTSTEVISWSGGADTTINGSAPTEQSFTVIDTNDKSYVTISDLTIYGGSGGGNVANLIGDGDAAHFLIVADSWLYSSDNVSLWTTGTDVKVSGVYAENNEGNGVFAGGNRSFVKSCTAINCGANPIRIGNYGTISGCYIASNIGGHGIQAGSFNTIIGNVIDDTATNADGINAQYDNVISGNYIANCGNNGSGIEITADYNVISNNVCNGDATMETCVNLTATADYNTVTGNISEGMATADFQETAGATNNLIYGNLASSATPYVLNGTLPGALRATGNIVPGTQVITCAADACVEDITKQVHFIVSEGGAEADADLLTLDNGTVAGQEATFIFQTETDAGDTIVIDTAQQVGWSDFTMAEVGDSVTFIWDGTNWTIKCAYQAATY